MRPVVSEADLEQLYKNMGKRVGGTGVSSSTARFSRDGAGARPALSSPYKGYRSKLEYNWANYLDGLKALKTIDDWRYEPMNFRLPGEKNFYKIDFQCWTGKAVTFYEIKGRNKSDERSLVKIKTAAGLHPWAKFVLVKRIGGQWEERLIQ